MKSLNWAGATALILLASPAVSQTAKDIIEQNRLARGGDAIDAIKSVRFEGKLIFPGDFQLTFNETRAANGGARTDASVQGLTLVSAYDGKSGWRINPFEGRKDAETMSADEARSFADTGSVKGPLLAARDDGSTITYLGKEDFDGTLAHKLKVVQTDGDEFVFLIDPDSMLEVKMVETRRVRGAQQTFEFEYGDYEKVAGVYFPMSIESWSQGQSANRQQVIVASGTANGEIPTGYFTQPTQAGK